MIENKYQRKHYESHKEQVIQGIKEYQEKYHDKVLLWREIAQKNQLIKKLNLVSNEHVCSCCNEVTIEFLATFKDKILCRNCLAMKRKGKCIHDIEREKHLQDLYKSI